MYFFPRVAMLAKERMMCVLYVKQEDSKHTLWMIECRTIIEFLFDSLVGSRAEFGSRATVYCSSHLSCLTYSWNNSGLFHYLTSLIFINNSWKILYFLFIFDWENYKRLPYVAYFFWYNRKKALFKFLLYKFSTDGLLLYVFWITNKRDL